MSIGFGVSHQKVGLNRVGRYLEPVRGIRAGGDARATSSTGGDAGGTAGKKVDHSKWRRISGMTEAVENSLTPKERHAGIARLVKRMKTFAMFTEQHAGADSVRHEHDGTDGTKRTNAARARADAVLPEGQKYNSPGQAQRRPGSGVPLEDQSPERARQRVTGKDAIILGEWDFELADWVCVSVDGSSVEALCAYLQITRAKLTKLTKEFCNKSPQEILDGFKVKRVKNMVLGRLRETARELWGSPGELAAIRAYAPDERSLAGLYGKKSKGCAYVMPDWYGKNLGEERARRKEELIARLRRNSDYSGLAVRFGFGTAARLKNACLNVLGRTPRDLENLLAADVVFYYVAAEVRVLREISCRESGAGVYRARELYHDSEDMPAEPWADLWAELELGNAAWLAAMAKALE